jgi:AraC-like DNA-binding protein
MKRLLEISSCPTSLALVLALLLSPVHSATADDSPSIEDLRLASQMGSSAPSSIDPTTASPSLTPPNFRGTSAHSCAALDLNTFLHQFDPHELLDELRQTLLSGVQSEVSNYLVALAYSAPTLVSVLDMTDRQLHARFTAFAQTCANQQVHAVGLQEAERRLARASDQCFAHETAQGSAPTDAYRRCSVSRSFDALRLPATLTTLDFLRQHSDLAVTPRVQSLLGLLPDERIVAGNYQVRPPKTSLEALSDALRVRTRLALEKVINGTPPATIGECPSDLILDTNGSACLPRSAFAIVGSPAFRSVRLLGPAALSMFKDALSGQIAVTAIYSDLLDLGQLIAGMNLRNESDASASEILSRQRALQDNVIRLLGQADLRVKLQEYKLQLARTQLLALERSRTDLQTQANALQQAQANPPIFSVTSVLRLFQERN